MATNPVDPIDEELNRLLADPRIAARLDAYLERKRNGTLDPGIPHEEVGRLLGLTVEDDLTADDE